MVAFNNAKAGPVAEFMMDQKAETDTTHNLEVAVAAALEGPVPTLHEDFLYSATAENRVEEVAVDGQDMDDEPGIIYSGPSGVTIRVQIDNFDIDAATTIAAAQIDTVCLGLYVNNTLVDYADEGFLTELDNEVADEFNLDVTIRNLQENDVIRVAYVQGTENAELDLDLLNTGQLRIS